MVMDATGMAAARLHVAALTEAGLPRESLLHALLEDYDRQGPSGMAPGTAHDAHLSVSSASSGSGCTSLSSRRTSVLTALTAATSACSARTPLLAPEVPPKNTPTKMACKRQSAGTAAPGPGPGRAYWCSHCQAKFPRKSDWKRHEDEFHERYKKYPCPDCNRVFWGAATFAQHHGSAHGCAACPHADGVVVYTKKRRAWSCGFCAALLPSRDRYFDHVARHYEAGCAKAHWNHSNCIYGLLHQEPIYAAWKQLLADVYGHVPKAQQPRFAWDPDATGHAPGFLEGHAPGKLQDLLEFFGGGRREGAALARLALDLAIKAFAQPPGGGARRPQPQPPGQSHSRSRNYSTGTMADPTGPRPRYPKSIAETPEAAGLGIDYWTPQRHGPGLGLGLGPTRDSMNAAPRASLMAPSTVDDWISLAGTMVDDSISEAQWLHGGTGHMAR